MQNTILINAIIHINFKRNPSSCLITTQKFEVIKGEMIVDDKTIVVRGLTKESDSLFVLLNKDTVDSIISVSDIFKLS